MSLKENINMVKEELSSEEKFFEKAVVTERFVKKYKNLIIGTVVAIVIVVVANIINESNKESAVLAANESLTKLTSDATNAEALSELKSNSPALYDVWIFSQAIVKKDTEALKALKGSDTTMLDDLVAYELAQDADSLDSYASKQGAVYKDLALVQSAVLLINEGKIEEAHQKLVKVSENSSLKSISKVLLHYGVK